MPFKNPHPLYGVWQGMRRRCLTPTYKQWADYGGRGIRICPEWDSFDRFVKDMSPRISPRHSLDRIDNDKNYEPSNCRWATRKEQQRNRRVAVFVLVEGVKYRAIELAEKYNLKSDTVVARAKDGLSFDLVTSPRKVRNMHSWKSAVAVRVANQRNASHCKHGHEWTTENTAITPQGWKRCKTCHRAKMQRLNKAKSLLR
jgi:hypothetical protein